MRFFQFFHRLGCLGYSLLGLILSFPLIPIAFLILRSGDERMVAVTGNLELVVIACVAALVVLWRDPGLLIGALLWVPIYFVSYVAILLSFNMAGNGYALARNPEFREWGGFLYSLIAYQVPLVAVYTARNWRHRTGWFAANVAQMEKRKNVPGLIRALENRNVQTRREAVRALWNVGDVCAVEPLIAALEDGDGDVRQWAVMVLGKLRDQRAFAPLVAALQDPSTAVASSAVDSLYWIDSDRAVEPLLAVLQSRREGVSSPAARNLGHLGDPRAVEPLIEALDADRALRDAAAVALVILGAQRGLEAIKLRLRSHPSERGDILKALARLEALTDPELQAWVAVEKGDWEGATLLGEAAVEPLCTRLWAKKDASLAAIQVLAQIRSPKAVPALSSRMNGGDVLEIRAAAARVLGQIGGIEAVGVLIQALGNATDYVKWGDIVDYPISLDGVQCAAAESLGQLGDWRAVEPLIAALQEPGGDLPRTAVSALHQITGQDFGLDATVWQAWWQQYQDDEAGQR